MGFNSGSTTTDINIASKKFNSQYQFKNNSRFKPYLNLSYSYPSEKKSPSLSYFEEWKTR